MTSNYPPGTFELPGDGEIEKEYLFEFYGEVTVAGYSEEDAERNLNEDIKSLLFNAWLDGDIEII